MTPTELAIEKLPRHLRPYVVIQDYSLYTSRDQILWRYVLSQLAHLLKDVAHPIYLDGLIGTGIDVDHIPSLDEMNIKLNGIGWSAVAVRGFIPPSVFTELQSLRYLAIAEDIRSHRHPLYTPAPDIIHESAGHAPILMNKRYSTYLEACGLVGFRSIGSLEDRLVFDAIRQLSIIKEDPHSTPMKIKDAEDRLRLSQNSHRYTSESTKASRLYWWTAEYGLIGSLNEPRLYGAGLLSSLGEARECLKQSTHKIPLSLACVDQPFDITRMQPQLFVAKDFDHLFEVLDQFKSTLSWLVGGYQGLSEALLSRTINTALLKGGTAVSGVIDMLIGNVNEVICFGISTASLIKEEGSFSVPRFSRPLVVFNGHLSASKNVTTIKTLESSVDLTIENNLVIKAETSHTYLRESLSALIPFKPVFAEATVSVYAGPENADEWGKHWGNSHQDFYDNQESMIRSSKHAELQGKLLNLYDQANALALDGNTSSDKTKLAHDANQFPDEILLKWQIDQLSTVRP